MLIFFSSYSTSKSQGSCEKMEFGTNLQGGTAWRLQKLMLSWIRVDC
jgi:hypothetical protein